MKSQNRNKAFSARFDRGSSMLFGQLSILGKRCKLSVGHDFYCMWWLLKELFLFLCYLLSAMSNARPAGFFPARCKAGREFLKELFCFQGAGATRSSIPGLQNWRISRYRYCFRSWDNPWGLTLGGSTAGGRMAEFFRSCRDCSGDELYSLK